MSQESFDEITGGWDYRTAPANVRIGRDCFFERKHSLERFRSTQPVGLVIGDRTRIYTWTTFNVERTGAISIGADCVLVGAVFMCAGRIALGNRVIVSYNVTIADSDFHPIAPELRKLDAIANAPFGDKSARPAYDSRPVVIEDDVVIGIGAIVLKGITIGRGARIGAGAVVSSNVAAGTRVAGNPARVQPEGAP
jgi:acetyltransferase-like isoleucine patch superfamily enzyme